MMELGATVCLPRSPLCSECPVRELCATQGEHPIGERKKMLSRQAACAFVRRQIRGRSEVLLEKRPLGVSLMPGMWELPSLDPECPPHDRVALTVRHSITVTNYYVSVYEVDAKSQKALLKTAAERRWFAVADLRTVPLTGLARKALTRLNAWPGFEHTGPSAAPPPIAFSGLIAMPAPGSWPRRARSDARSRNAGPAEKLLAAKMP
jgi:A/G-specific adenine glycosylase